MNGKRGTDLKRYNRVAGIYDLFEAPMEFMNFKKWRELFFGYIGLDPLKHDSLVLEVGVGTGKNVPFYPDSRIVAIDISEKMIKKANDRARKLGKVLSLIVADVEDLPFKDGVFDMVFATFVFCSVENPVTGLKELYRVLKDDGKALFMEHMLPESRFAQPLFHALNPIVRIFGPEINRKTDENIRKAGFNILQQKYLLGSVFRMIVAEK